MEKLHQTYENTLLDHPDIAEKYKQCLENEDTDEQTYLYGIAALVMATDLAYGDPHATKLPIHDIDTVIDTALLLADVHYQTKHYEYCLGEVYSIVTKYSKRGEEPFRRAWDYIDMIVKDTMGSIPAANLSAVSSQILTK